MVQNLFVEKELSDFILRNLLSWLSYSFSFLCTWKLGPKNNNGNWILERPGQKKE